MKRLIIAMILSVISLVAILMVLSSKTEPKDISLADFASSFEAEYESGDDCFEQADARRLKKNFGINASDYAEICYFYSTDMMSATELLIVKLADESQQSSVEQAMEDRLEARKNAFDGYGSDQMAILKDAIIGHDGNYVYFIVSQESRSWLQFFKKEIGGVRHGFF